MRALPGAALALLVSAAPSLADGTCAEDRIDLRSPKGQARFTVEIADTADERAQGLMFRESLGAMKGMLFVYERAEPVAFWMENTLIPLDIIFAGADGVVVSVQAGAKPLDRTALPSGAPAQFVLEINAGMAARLGIGPGTEMRHPRIGQGAAWPCG